MTRACQSCRVMQTISSYACGRFIRLAGGDAKICEYNQEACRLNTYDGKKSLIRSFPSKVGVSTVRLEPREGVGRDGEEEEATGGATTKRRPSPCE